MTPRPQRLTDERLAEICEGRGRHWHGEAYPRQCGCNMDVQELRDHIAAITADLTTVTLERDTLAAWEHQHARALESARLQRDNARAELQRARAEALEEAAKVCDAEAEQRRMNSNRARDGDATWGDPKSATMAQGHKSITAAALASDIRALPTDGGQPKETKE